MKKLTELNPEWTGVMRQNSGEGIVFDCPACGPRHRLAAYFSNPLDGKEHLPRPQNQIWQRDGKTFETLTISPSIDYGCFHGWVERGWVIAVSESPFPGAERQPDGSIREAVLSPLQAIEYAKSIIIAAEIMLSGKPIRPGG